MQRVLFFIVFAIHFSGPSKYISSNFQTVHKALKIYFFFSYKENVDLRRHPPFRQWESPTRNKHQRNKEINTIKETSMSISKASELPHRKTTNPFYISND